MDEALIREILLLCLRSISTKRSEDERQRRRLVAILEGEPRTEGERP